jgi:hypothetical protein
MEQPPRDESLGVQSAPETPPGDGVAWFTRWSGLGSMGMAAGATLAIGAAARAVGSERDISTLYDGDVGLVYTVLVVQAPLAVAALAKWRTAHSANQTDAVELIWVGGLGCAELALLLVLKSLDPLFGAGILVFSLAAIVSLVAGVGGLSRLVPDPDPLCPPEGNRGAVRAAGMVLPLGLGYVMFGLSSHCSGMEGQASLQSATRALGVAIMVLGPVAGYLIARRARLP